MATPTIGFERNNLSPDNTTNRSGWIQGEGWKPHQYTSLFAQINYGSMESEYPDMYSAKSTLTALSGGVIFGRANGWHNTRSKIGLRLENINSNVKNPGPDIKQSSDIGLAYFMVGFEGLLEITPKFGMGMGLDLMFGRIWARDNIKTVGQPGHEKEECILIAPTGSEGPWGSPVCANNKMGWDGGFMWTPLLLKYSINETLSFRAGFDMDLFSTIAKWHAFFGIELKHIDIP